MNRTAAEIRNIVNEDLINLLNCDLEPIHIPGTIQPHGFLLVVSGHELNITFCSANVEAFISIKPEHILNRTLSQVFPHDEALRLGRYIEDFVPDASYPHVLTLNDVSYNTTVHKTDDQYLLEMEPFPDGHLSLPDLYAQTRTFISFIENAGYLQELCAAVAEETRRITGYDRVMIYRFDQDYNGEVFAESRRADLQSFLDHRYPHTDIPVQARELYLRNQLRIIADVNYKPVPVLTMKADAGNASVDMSNAILRSVSPVHIEYLRNMEVAATLTISLIRDGKLWGLIACHHYSPKILPHYTRLAARMQGSFLTSQIGVLEVKEEYDITTKVEAHLQELQYLLLKEEYSFLKVYRLPALTGLANAKGVAILYENSIYKSGDTPDDHDIHRLAKWMSDHIPDGYAATDHLAAFSDSFEDIAPTASGIIYHTLSRHSNNAILWFRPEVVQTLDWAGDPNKAVLKGENGMRLTPRKSFDLWRQEVKFRSIPWRKPELNAAASFAYALQKNILYHYLSLEEKRYRKLSEKLQEANDELENINWISTHDLKEPLRKIQIFGSRILETEKGTLPQTVHDSVERMRSAANRMQQLLDDMLVYSRITNKEQAFEPVDMNRVLADVLESLSEETEQLQATIQSDDLPVVSGIGFQLKQLFFNLLSNALKFSRKEVPLSIRITCEVIRGAAAGKPNNHDEYYRISVRDNGIGFDEAYASRIFEMFQRLHHNSEYKGTGIGLSICRKIMTNHDGYITAAGEAGNGATFTVYFPVPATA